MYRVEEIAARTGLPDERVRGCPDLLFEQGCVRQAGCAPDGAPVRVLPQGSSPLTEKARSRKTRLRLRAFSYPAGFQAPGPSSVIPWTAGTVPRRPFWKSSNACISSSLVFMTNGP